MCCLVALTARLATLTLHSNSSQLNFVKIIAETPGCDFAIAEGFLYHSVNSVLTVVSPTVNDTGEVVCNNGKPTDGRGSSLYIAVGKFRIFKYSVSFMVKLCQYSVHRTASREY